MKNIPVTIMFVIAELIGAIIFYKTKDTFKRMVLSCLGLGFAIAVVFLDIIPDATENYSFGYWICAIGIIVMLVTVRIEKHIGNYSAVAGLGIHNFAEGIIINSVAGPVSPFIVLGAVLHKLPEGMVSFSLLEDLKDGTRFLVAGIIALVIPIGALAPIPESITKPVMAFASGVILFVVVKSLILIIAQHYKSEATEKPKVALLKLASVALVGGTIGWVSCLLA